MFETKNWTIKYSAFIIMIQLYFSLTISVSSRTRIRFSFERMKYRTKRINKFKMKSCSLYARWESDESFSRDTFNKRERAQTHRRELNLIYVDQSRDKCGQEGGRGQAYSGWSQIECLMDAYTMKRSVHANQCRRGISHHPPVWCNWVFVGSWERERRL